MKKIVIKYQSWLIWLALAVATIPTFLTLIRPGFFAMQDDLQAFRTHQLDQCVKDWQWPCRWVPDAGYQYGYPQFIYYPPSVYYAGEIWHLLGFQFIDSVKIMFGLGYLLSAWAMYLLLKDWLGKWPAVVGTILYTYIPYKAVEVYVRGAMSEFWSLVFFPLIFWSTRRVVLQRRWRDVGVMALTVGGLFLTHNLMSLIFFPVAGIWTLVWLYQEKAWRLLPKLIVGGLLGLGLAAFFTLPVLAEGKYVHLESLLGGYFDYRQHFADIDQLFLNNHWGYGSSELGPGDDLSLTTGIIQWMVAGLAGLLAVVKFKTNKKLSIMTGVLLVVELMVLFLIHQKSSFIWAQISYLAYLQFPWRFLSVSIFLLAILDAIAIYYLAQFKLKWLSIGTGLGVMVIAVLMTINFYQPREWYDISDQDKFSGISWEKQLTISIFDYTPIYAVLPPPSKAPEVPELLDGQGQVLEYRKGSNHQSGIIMVETPLVVRLPLFDFPGMQVKVDGQVVDHWHDDCRGQKYCMGLVTFGLPPGQHQVEVKLTRTPIRLFGDLATLGSIVGVGWLLTKKR